MTTSNEAMIEANTFDANGNISPKTFQFSQHLQEPPGVNGNVTKKKLFCSANICGLLSPFTWVNTQ